MPQMKPMNWLLLMMYFITLLLIILTTLNFFIKLNNKFNKFSTPIPYFTDNYKFKW